MKLSLFAEPYEQNLNVLMEVTTASVDNGKM